MVYFDKPKPAPKVAGHKCLGAFRKFEVACECGWYSCPHTERREAYSEYREHIRTKHPDYKAP